MTLKTVIWPCQPVMAEPKNSDRLTPLYLKHVPSECSELKHFCTVFAFLPWKHQHTSIALGALPVHVAGVRSDQLQNMPSVVKR